MQSRIYVALRTRHIAIFQLMCCFVAETHGNTAADTARHNNRDVYVNRGHAGDNRNY